MEDAADAGSALAFYRDFSLRRMLNYWLIKKGGAVYEQVTHPVTGPKAFERTDDAAALSQAAILLLLGAQLRGDAPAFAARIAALERVKRPEAIPARDLDDFPVPELRRGVRRVVFEAIREGLKKRYGSRLIAEVYRKQEPKKLLEVLPDLAARLYKQHAWSAAAQLLEAALAHPHELVRVAAAASHFGMASDPKRLIAILRHATRSRTELIRDVAATALARISPGAPELSRLIQTQARRRRGTKSHTLVLVHGTWGRNAAWWQPGGDFYTYLRSAVRPDVYGAADRYRWSGGYSDAARALAARDLVSWVNRHQFQGLDLFSHSHGANVSLLATQFCLRAGTLVLLSCPVHPHKYRPDFTKVKKVVSVRVRLDLVILADRGGQRFPKNSGIHENVLPIWFDHSATHEPSVWTKYKVPSMF